MITGGPPTVESTPQTPPAIYSSTLATDSGSLPDIGSSYQDITTVTVTGTKFKITVSISAASAGGGGTAYTRVLVDGSVTAGLGGWNCYIANSGIEITWTNVITLSEDEYTFKLQAGYSGSGAWSINPVTRPNQEFATLIVEPVT